MVHFDILTFCRSTRQEVAEGDPNINMLTGKKLPFEARFVS